MVRTSRWWAVAGMLALAAAGCCGVGVSAEAGTRQIGRSITLPAEQVFEQGMAPIQVQRGPDGIGVVLADTTLVEDDGPGSGSTSPYVLEAERSPVVVLDDSTRVKKVLHVERPGALEARLYVEPGVAVELNGVAVDTPTNTKFPPIPVDLLRTGDNEFVLSKRGESAVTIKVAARRHIIENAPERATRPARSFRSTDGGATCEPIDGELTVRLSLRQYAREGHLISPVIDLGLPEGKSISPANASIRTVAATADADVPDGCGLRLAVRTGASPVYESQLWSDWGPPGQVKAQGHRFAQWKATLTSTDAKATPVLRAVTLTADVDAAPQPDWAQEVTVRDVRNADIRYSAMPFTYEDPAHPKLVALREKYKLDDVVKEGQTELEKLVLLRDWVAHQWRYKPPLDGYPAWDAHEILERKVGMCVQYAIVYVECAASLGYQARFVFGFHPGTMGSAHEVCEVWSNEYGKWVFMDPNANRHHVDPETGEPLSMLDVHDRMIETYYGDRVAMYEHRPRQPAYSDRIATCQGRAMTPPDASGRGDEPPRRWLPWTKWLCVRYVPRNDFYSRPVPLPRAQGWNGYDWTGYWEWHDAQTPRDWRYPHATDRRADVEWTLNQVRFSMACGDKPGVIDVQMGTMTPHFDTYLVRTDGGDWQPAGRTFAWRLHAGGNRLEMRVRNTSGVLGHVSFAELDYGS